ncbi:bifunctional 2-polyprenyl-6-hydroxyphenol methylase/3-demethylubiquinol 3-O-methyltransferase UbiG [Fangia hongkongensis]|uniref:bifunctional 2-polyprenyl-6-hydroxyphenol methylase/3-demethylubiquinol 3-O-methyltransferase UbiG n=1 Tax=Fangia hongkongensis TaxID=270495 RepID=UPI0003669683|nr:bifunctional 2-polyprenyl-6-hydroxyphenol methylase/3-demethylubiquinol 3-O-methyltransferase UbiG [Fangia hongkongensis]MBK2125494.1 bifunctional 2-polyprenyl-6-hydroxyphenol methylase/3-demethylubiquinol 3-O-methyltransferase UbiG [Fangia hongkongensis]
MNVDQKEINKFSALAHQWWCEDGEFRTLHQVNPLRVSFIEQRVKSLTGLQILDVGCGGGILSEALAKKGAKVTGIDMAKASLKVAKLHLLESDLEVDYRCITAEALADISPESFDVVSSMEMLEHVPEPKSVIKACSELVKEGGWVFFSTLNRNLKSYLLSVVMAEHVLKLIPKGTHEYEKFIKPSELIRSAKEYGLFPKIMKGIHYNPLTKTFSMGGNADVNYIIAFQKA